MIWWLLATLVVGVILGAAGVVAYINYCFYKEGL